MKNLKYFLLLSSVIIIGFSSCKKDDPGPNPIVVSTIEAKGTSFEDGSDVTKDLNGASSASDVALNSTFTITFDRDVDATTVTSSNVSLSTDDGALSAGLQTSGRTVTLTPDTDLVRGTMHTLSISGVTATDGGSFSAITRSFTSEGRAPVTVPNESDMIAYWTFDGSANDATGAYPADNVVAINFGDDRFGQGNSTASFDGDESLIEVLNGDRLMESNDFTISFWIKTNSDGHVNADGNPANHFVFGLGAFFGFQFEIPADVTSCKLAMSYELADGTKESEDLWFNGSGEDNMNGGWQGWDFVADLTGSGGVEAILKDKWTHIVCTYNATDKTGRMYFNGELMKGQDFNLWPDGAPKTTATGVSYRGVDTDVENILAFGFIKSADSPMWADTPWGDYFKPTSNHFKGDLDDVRVFKAPFSADDAKALYDAEKNLNFGDLHVG